MAYRPPGQERLGIALRALAALLAAALALLVLRWRKESAGSLSEAEKWDTRIVLAATCVFLLVALVIAIRPELLLPEGNPGRTWRNAGGGALLGLAAAFGWFARDSKWRLVGVAITAIAAVALLEGMPSGKYGSAGLEKALPAVILGLSMALWNLIAFARAHGKGSATARPSALAAPMLIAAALIFGPPNYLSGLSRAVVSVDLETGDLLWQTTVLRGPAEQKWPRGTFANPTPATDGEAIFAYFGHGLTRLDLDGKLEWRVDFPGYAQHTRYGAGVSPVLTDDEVLLVKESELYQGGPPSWIAAFDKGTGEVRWRIEPPDAHDSYATPLLYRAGATQQLVTASWETLVSYDATSGEELWSVDYPMQQMVASIAGWNDLLAVSGGSHGEKVLMVLRVSGEGRESRAELLWQTNKGVATIASPIFYDGMLFTLTTPGILTAHAPESGTVLWKKRLDGEHMASLIAGDGKLYAVSNQGTTTVVATSQEEPKVLAENPLEEPVYASPAVAGGCLLIRTTRSLFCVEAARAEPPS